MWFNSYAMFVIIQVMVRKPVLRSILYVYIVYADDFYYKLAISRSSNLIWYSLLAVNL